MARVLGGSKHCRGSADALACLRILSDADWCSSNAGSKSHIYFIHCIHNFIHFMQEGPRTMWMLTLSQIQDEPEATRENSFMCSIGLYMNACACMPGLHGYLHGEVWKLTTFPNKIMQWLSGRQPFYGIYFITLPRIYMYIDVGGNWPKWFLELFGLFPGTLTLSDADLEIKKKKNSPFICSIYSYCSSKGKVLFCIP